MKTFAHAEKRAAAFTLIELLTVIAIIGILASLLLVVIPRVITAAKVHTAKIQIAELVTAIGAYETAYSRYPVSQAVQKIANPDFTYGGIFHTPTGFVTVGTSVGTGILTNDQIIAVLMSFTNYPGTMRLTSDANDQANPQKINFITSPKLTGDTSSPGVGSDLVYRDPWGNPYVISLDLNDDGWCEDDFYKAAAISGGGINGLILQPDGNYAFHGKIMVWSAGPDGKVNQSVSANQ